jgi:phage terminase large subunit
VDTDGSVWVLDESCVPNLSLTEAAETVSALCRDQNVEFAVASPDLWNRRQDSGKSGYEIMQAVYGMPPMLAADDRRIAGWRMVREYLSCRTSPSLHVTRRCEELIRCLPALLFDSEKTEDASGEPHSVTHAPEALRYALMSRCQPPVKSLSDDFIIPKKRTGIFY